MARMKRTIPPPPRPPAPRRLVPPPVDECDLCGGRGYHLAVCPYERTDGTENLLTRAAVIAKHRRFET